MNQVALTWADLSPRSGQFPGPGPRGSNCQSAPGRRTIVRIRELRPCSWKARSEMVPSQSGDFTQALSGFRLNRKKGIVDLQGSPCRCGPERIIAIPCTTAIVAQLRRGTRFLDAARPQWHPGNPRGSVSSFFGPGCHPPRFIGRFSLCAQKRKRTDGIMAPACPDWASTRWTCLFTQLSYNEQGKVART